MKQIKDTLELKLRRRSNFSRENFSTVFAVFDDNLSFYASEEQWSDGRDPIAQVAPSIIICIERMTGEVDGRENVIQLYFDEEEGQQHALLAFTDDECCQSWLRGIRTASLHNETWMTHFHDGEHTAGRWTCCRSARRTNTGCKETTILGLPRRLDGFTKFSSPPQASQLQGFSAISKVSYESTASGQLTVQKDEKLTVLDASDRWIWRAHCHSTNRSGLLPQTILYLPDIFDQPWFFRELSSPLALFILRPHGPGSFLIRSCRKRLILSINARDVIKHVGIYQTEEGQYYVISTDVFDTLVQLLDHYRRNQVFGVHLQTYPTTSHLYAYWLSDMSSVKVLEDLNTPFAWSAARGCYRDVDNSDQLMLFQDHKTSTESSHGRLREVADILLCLHHSNIQRLLALGSNDGIFTMVTDYHGDVNIKDFLLDTSVKVSTYLKLMTDVCVGLAYLDKRGIVHNELIPENCIVKDASASAVITGFHFAQFEGVSQQSTNISFVRHRLTPPEASSSVDTWSVTTKSDMWSYGVLLWITYNFQECAHITVDDIMDDKQPGNGDHVKENLLKITTSCLRKEPASRPTVRDVWRQLRQVQKSLPYELPSKIPRLTPGRSNMSERNQSFSSTSTQQTTPNPSVLLSHRRASSNISLLSSLAGSSPNKSIEGDVTNIRSTLSPRDVSTGSSSVKSLPIGKSAALSYRNVNMTFGDSKKWTSLSDFAGNTLKNIRHAQIEMSSNSTLHDSSKTKSGSSSAISNFGEGSFEGDEISNKTRSNIMLFGSQESLQQNESLTRNTQILRTCKDILGDETFSGVKCVPDSEATNSNRGSWRSSLASGFSGVSNQQLQTTRTDPQLSKAIQMAQRSKYKYHVIRREKDAILQASEDNEKKYRTEVATLTSKLNECNKQLETSRNEIITLQKCFDDNIIVANSALERLQRERSEMEQENKLVGERNDTLGQEVELLTDENQNLGEQVVRLLEENNKLKSLADHSNFLQEIKLKADEITSLRESENILQTSFTHVSEKNSKLSDENASLSQDVIRLSNQIETFEEQMEHFKAEHLTLKENAESLDKENMELKDLINRREHFVRDNYTTMSTHKRYMPKVSIKDVTDGISLQSNGEHYVSPNIDENSDGDTVMTSDDGISPTKTSEGTVTGNSETCEDNVPHHLDNFESREHFNNHHDINSHNGDIPRDKTRKTAGSILSRLPRLSLWNHNSRTNNANENKKISIQQSPSVSQISQSIPKPTTSTRHDDLKSEFNSKPGKPSRLAKPSSFSGVKFLGQPMPKSNHVTKMNGLRKNQSMSTKNNNLLTQDIDCAVKGNITNLLSRADIRAQKRLSQTLTNEQQTTKGDMAVGKGEHFLFTSGQKVTLV